MRLLHLIGIAILTASCGGGSVETNAPAGTEGGECRPDGSCDADLTCLSNRCVIWDDDSDDDTDMGTSSNNTIPNNNSANNNMMVDLGTVDFGDNEGVVPAAPFGLTAVAGPDVSIELSWTDAADNEGGFVVQRRDEFFQTEFEDVTLTAPDTNSYLDEGLVKGVEYTYRVRAVNNAGSSEASNEAALRTPWPTLDEDMNLVFNQSCGSGDVECHARNQYAATPDRACRGWLSLEDSPLGSEIYDMELNVVDTTSCPDRDLLYRLTEITAWQCGESDFVNGEANYVVPGDPENSYVWQKIEGTRLCDNGGEPSEIMPQTGELDPVNRILIRQWIAGGAQP